MASDDQATFRVQPHNIEAEQALLGAILVNNDAFHRVGEYLLAEHFFEPVHARIFEHEGQPVLEDLGSTNGSYLNGSKVAGIKLLHPGDRVLIGYTVLEAQ